MRKQERLVGMECNKDEAIRAKQLAEKKLTEKDIIGAKRFASKAQNLFPGLEGLSQLHEILDVYAASQKKVNGEVDWYAIFGVDPLADDETIRRKYRKLALALHPDKNKSVGADGAFKIISEAWSLLSDKAKRNAYNEKRNIKASYQKARGGNPPAGTGKGIYKNFTNSSSKPKNPTTQDKSRQDINKKGRGKNPPAAAGKSSCTNFTKSSSSTINPSTQDKPQEDTRPSNEKARGGNPPAVAGKSNYDNFTGSSSSTINPATPDNLQQDIRASFQKARDGNPPAAAGKSGQNTFSNSSSGTRNLATPEHSRTLPAPRRANRSTFWTSCKTCMMQYEYVHIYRNQKLLCPNCRKPFLAREMPPPHAANKSSTKGPFRPKQQGPNNNVFGTSSNSGRKSMGTSVNLSFNSMSRADVPHGLSSKCSGGRSESRPVTSTGQPAQNFQPVDENIKRGHEERVNGAVNEEALWQKGTAPKKPDSDGSDFAKGEIAAKKRRIDEQMPYVGESGSQMGVLGREKVDVSGSKKHACVRDLSQSESCNMLMYKAKMAILNAVSELVTNSSAEACRDMEKEMPNAYASEESAVSSMKKEERMNFAFDHANSSAQAKTSLISSGATNSDTKATKILAMTVPVIDERRESSLSAEMVGSDWKATESMTMIVPNSEFIDFDKDRVKESFAENQVWAAYDDEDGMPRFYALVQGVTSCHPSKVNVSWLNSRSNAELGTLNWVHCGFSKTCGHFRISRCEVDEEVNCFSHKVRYTRFARGVIQIFPRKGDVWALYRNWSSDWNELTPDDVIRKYDMVEVLEDYNEECGVPVAPLVKVAAFKSVFHQHLDPGKIYTISRDEMLRFSHQVPSRLLAGCGGEKRAPKGCRELDPAAMPEELLRVIAEPEEEEVEGMSTFGEDRIRAEVRVDEGAAEKCMEWANRTQEGMEILSLS